MNREDWDKTYTERNAKAEMWGAGIAGIFFLFPIILILGIWNPNILFFIPLLSIWIIWKRRNNRNK